MKSLTHKSLAHEAPTVRVAKTFLIQLFFLKAESKIRNKLVSQESSQNLPK